MCIFSKYKDILGIPNKGIHRFRFLNTAIVDYIGTILLSIILTLITKIPLVLSTIIMFLLSVVLHYLFCVKTNTLKLFNII
tara:strand:- start:51 stop:293 length:243 start_codon:yes stop_codon:yes gene_type:complete